MPASRSVCLAAFNEEQDLYIQVVQASLALTTFNVLLYVICFRKRLEGAPGLASQFFLTTGSMKLVMGILIAILFLPRCPENCATEVCEAASEHFRGSPFYALICSLVGLVWIQKGYTYHQRAQVLENGESEGAQDIVFNEVPTVEVV